MADFRALLISSKARHESSIAWFKLLTFLEEQMYILVTDDDENFRNCILKRCGIYRFVLYPSVPEPIFHSSSSTIGVSQFRCSKESKFPCRMTSNAPAHSEDWTVCQLSRLSTQEGINTLSLTHADQEKEVAIKEGA
jgi:hypothetical protein